MRLIRFSFSSCTSWIFVLFLSISLKMSNFCYNVGCSILFLLQHMGSVVAAHRLSSCGSQALEHRLSSGTWLSCSVACGMFLDQREKPYPLIWQAGSYPQCHHGSPTCSNSKSRSFFVPKSSMN